MSPGVKIGVGFVLGVLIGGGPGFFSGWSMGTKRMVANWITAEAKQTDQCVGALELLRKQKEPVSPEASAALEDHLDRHVQGIMPSMRGTIEIPGSTEQGIAKTKARIQAYRQAHPRPANKTLRYSEVKQYLESQ